MSDKTDIKTNEPVGKTAEVYSFFGPASSLPGESRNGYIDLGSRILAWINKSDIIECGFGDRLFHATRRCQSLSSNIDQLINGARKPALRELLTATLAGPDVSAKIEGWLQEWFGGDISRELTEHMGRYNISERTISAEAFLRRLSEIEHLEVLLAQAERHRETALDGLMRYRAALDKRPRRGSDDIIDVRPQDITKLAPNESNSVVPPS